MMGSPSSHQPTRIREEMLESCLTKHTRAQFSNIPPRRGRHHTFPAREMIQILEPTLEPRYNTDFVKLVL